MARPAPENTLHPALQAVKAAGAAMARVAPGDTARAPRRLIETRRIVQPSDLASGQPDNALAGHFAATRC